MYLLISQCTKACDTCLDPIILIAKLDLCIGFGDERRAEDGILFGRYFNPRHEIGGMTGGRQGTYRRII